MKERCFMVEIGRLPKNNPYKPWKFKSRLMSRYGWLWFAVCIIKMSLFDYEKEIESGGTEWKK